MSIEISQCRKSSLKLFLLLSNRPNTTQKKKQNPYASFNLVGVFSFEDSNYCGHCCCTPLWRGTAKTVSKRVLALHICGAERVWTPSRTAFGWCASGLPLILWPGSWRFNSSMTLFLAHFRCVHNIEAKPLKTSWHDSPCSNSPWPYLRHKMWVRASVANSPLLIWVYTSAIDLRNSCATALAIFSKSVSADRVGGLSPSRISCCLRVEIS